MQFLIPNNTSLVNKISIDSKNFYFQLCSLDRNIAMHFPKNICYLTFNYMRVIQKVTYVLLLHGKRWLQYPCLVVRVSTETLYIKFFVSLSFLVHVVSTLITVNTIENPMSCEMQSVIWFSITKKLRSIKIYQELCRVYGNGIMSKTRVKQ